MKAQGERHSHYERRKLLLGVTLIVIWVLMEGQIQDYAEKSTKKLADIGFDKIQLLVLQSKTDQWQQILKSATCGQSLSKSNNLTFHRMTSPSGSLTYHSHAPPTAYTRSNVLLNNYESVGLLTYYTSHNIQLSYCY